MSPPRDWSDILDTDEHILWQGQPDPGPELSIPGPAMGLFVVFWLGTGAMWVTDLPGSLPFALVHLAIGAAALAKPLLWDPMARRHTWYSLSNKRAYIATNLPFNGKRLRSYTLDADNRVTLENGPLYTVNFITSILTPQQDMRAARSRLRQPLIRQRHGFERLHDGPQVYHLIQDIQTPDRQEPPQ